MTLRRPRLPLRLRNRRGSILVWFGMTITLILLVTAVVVDYGYWYAAQAELQTAADAAALRGARRLQMSVETGTALDIDVDSVTVNFSPRNRAQGESVTIDSTQVRLAWWDPQPLGGMPGQPIFNPASWPTEATGPNAVVVDNAQQGHRLFGHIFGLARPNLGKRAIAWRAYLNAGKCIRPWGIPMSQIVHMVTGTDSTYRKLTGSEVAQLAQLTDVQRTIVMVPPRKTLKPFEPAFEDLPPNTGEWTSLAFDMDATSTGSSGITEFQRLSAGGCLTSEDGFGVEQFARSDIPGGNIKDKMMEAVTGGYRRELGATCTYTVGSANCYASSDSLAAGAIGKIINVAYTSSPGAMGRDPVQAYMLGQFKVMCIFRDYPETCDWAPAPFASTGYPPGTMVGYPIADFFLKLTDDIELGNLPSTSSRLLLVR